MNIKASEQHCEINTPNNETYVSLSALKRVRKKETDRQTDGENNHDVVKSDVLSW